MSHKSTQPLRPAGRDADWLEKWAPPCPDGNPQRLLEMVGFRVKGPDLIQLRVILTRRDPGVCQVLIEEHPDVIYARVLACVPPGEERRGSQRDYDELDCGYRWWLDEPLGERVVIDVDTGQELPYMIPRWDIGEPSLYVPRPRGLLWPPELVQAELDADGAVLPDT